MLSQPSQPSRGRPSEGEPSQGEPSQEEPSQPQTSPGSIDRGAPCPRNDALRRVAERELMSALVEQERPVAGMYLHPSRDGVASFDRAVRVVCAEAHRMDLRAEELLVALKQAWSLLVTTRARHLGDRDGDVLRDVVTTSIEVFFESRPARDDDRR